MSVVTTTMREPQESYLVDTALRFSDMDRGTVTLRTAHLQNDDDSGTTTSSGAASGELGFRITGAGLEDGQIAESMDDELGETTLARNRVQTRILAATRCEAPIDVPYLAVNHLTDVYPNGTIVTEKVLMRTPKDFDALDSHELVSKLQLETFFVDFLSGNVDLDGASLVHVIQQALQQITLPDVQRSKIEEVLNDYRLTGSFPSDVRQIVSNIADLVTSEDLAARDYLPRAEFSEFVPDTATLNVETSKLFDLPMDPFYLRLDDFVQNRIVLDTPNIADNRIEAANVVQLNFLENNYYTKQDIDNYDFGNLSFGNIAAFNFLLTKSEAADTYVKISDFMTDTGNVVLEYTVESDINIYQYDVNDIKTFVNAAQPEDLFLEYQVDETNENRITVTGFRPDEATGLASLDTNLIQVTDRLLFVYPMRNQTTDAIDRVYNGIFQVSRILTESTLVVERTVDFKSLQSMHNALIYVQSRSPRSSANGNSYVVSSPVLSTDLDTFVLNQHEIRIIPFIKQDNTHGSMAYQDHTNVLIQGGEIAVSRLNTSSIEPVASSLTVHLPPTQLFHVTSTVTSTVTQADAVHDPVFSVDEEGHVSAFQFTQMSDKRLKRNIMPIETPLHYVNQLNGVTFEWQDVSKNKRGRHYGYIAQDLYEKFPSMVSQTLSGHLTVDYAKAIPLLTEAVKELHGMVKKIMDEKSNPTTKRSVSFRRREGEAETETDELRTPPPVLVEPRQLKLETEPEHRPHDVPPVVVVDQSQSAPPADDARQATLAGVRAAGTCQRNVTVIPRPVPDRVVTNVYSIGKADQTYFVNCASTEYDDVTMEPLFVSVENRQIYSIFTNNGLNTIDGVALEIDDVVCIRTANDLRFNGVYKISGIQHVSFGRFSKCYRLDNFQTYEQMQHAIVVVQPGGLAGNGKGESNPGVSFTCVLDAQNEASFVRDTTDVRFVSFGLNPSLGTMSLQDQNDVNITGGEITTQRFQTSELYPYQDSNNITVNLRGATSNDTFEIKNESDETIFAVDGTGKASAFEYYAPSDRRLKRNVQPIDNALQLLNHLHGVTFDWKTSLAASKGAAGPKEPNKHAANTAAANYGFLAQDIVPHFPSLVHKRNDGYLSVDYPKVVPILVEAVKELSTLLDDMLSGTGSEPGVTSS